MTNKRFKPRVRVEQRAFACLRTGERVLIVTTDNNMFAQFHDGQTIVICTTSDRARRCRVIDHRRYTTVSGLTVEEPVDRLLNQPPTELPLHHLYVVLTIEPLPSIAELARLKTSA